MVITNTLSECSNCNFKNEIINILTKMITSERFIVGGSNCNGKHIYKDDVYASGLRIMNEIGSEHVRLGHVRLVDLHLTTQLARFTSSSNEAVL